jgi:hypothetical protein
MENKLDTLILLLNKIGSDRVMRRTENDVIFSYDFGDFNGVKVIQIYFKRKTDTKLSMIIRLTCEDESKIYDIAALQLLRYIIFAKDSNESIDLKGVPVIVYSAKTIFGNGQ